MRGLLRIQFVAAALCLSVAPVPAQQDSLTIVVPQLIGRTPAQARDALARLGLVLAAIDTTSSRAGAATGRIVDQKPAAGSKAARGTRVSVVVAVQRSASPPPVPDVIGLSLGEASQRLAAARLKPGNTSERDQFDKPAGVVLEQKPRAGDPAPPAGTVDLLVASEWTEVPTLRGLTADRAKVLLASRQLLLGAARDTPVAAAAGTIVYQAPSAGTRVRKNADVTVDVASTPAQDTLVTVPGITQQVLPDALRLLRAAQLRPGNVVRSDAANARAGVIADQRPQAGTRVQRNSAVDVVLATDSTVVPALIGRSIADTRALLSRNSLSLGPIDSLSNSASPGTVLRQNPAAQSRVPKRTAVSLTLALPAPAPTPPQPQDTTRRAVVPDLRGMTRDSAAAELQVRNLVSGAITTNPVGGTPDRVIAQSPAARSIVSAGTSVDLVFSVAQQPQPPVPVPVETVPAPPVPVTPQQPESNGFPWAIALGSAGVLAAAVIGLMLRAKAGRTPPPIVRPPTSPKAETSAGPQLTYEPVQESVATELQAKNLTAGLALEFVGEPALQPPETELQYATDLLQGADRE